jgi:hypothetical protein
MNYDPPPHLKISKKEAEKISEKLNTTAIGLAKNFLKGLFFFITAPISIYKKIRIKNENRRSNLD